MPKLSGVPIAHRRALNRLQVAGTLPEAALRLEPGVWVRTLRLALHMTQRQLAARAGISQAHLALIESGRSEPRLSHLRKVFDAIYCDMIVLPIPRKRIAAIIAEKTLGIPTRRMWDSSKAIR
ncbi:MAG: helix-turn-helix transcriptional regulator [Elusimicrobia bacterium]|nr:helix-turn-helix transcriptional regulator [Elusimicrobiota bacterium]